MTYGRCVIYILPTIEFKREEGSNKAEEKNLTVSSKLDQIK